MQIGDSLMSALSDNRSGAEMKHTVATILMVEDARELNNLLRPQVEDKGRRVIHACDAPGALTTAQLEHPDLVIRHQLGPTHKGDLQQGSHVAVANSAIMDHALCSDQRLGRTMPERRHRGRLGED
jgi:hypothetical protein